MSRWLGLAIVLAFSAACGDDGARGLDAGGRRDSGEPGDSGPTDAGERPDAGPPPDLPGLEGWPYRVAGVTVEVRDGLWAYNPHRTLAHRYRGNGHTHCAPDHSDFPSDAQERRLRDQAPGHAHQFVWMTAHNFVAPDPAIGGGFVHMFGVEIYAAEARNGEAPHMVAFLPDGSLADVAAEPFGRNDLVMAEVVTQVVAAGGLPVLAHPTDNGPGVDELIELAGDLWGVEAISAGRNVEDMLAMIDARLSAGKYTCISGGSDIHAEDHSLTTGHQLVSSDEAAPSREGIFEQVRACNFFACTVVSERHEPIEPALTIEGGAIRFTTGAPVDQIELVGRDGRVLMTATETSEVSYTPAGDEGYIRASASREPGGARCLSQPVWLLDEAPGG